MNVTTEEYLKKSIRELTTELNLEKCIHAKPNTELHLYLSQKTVPELRKICKIAEQKGYSKMTKSDLIEALTDAYEKREILEIILFGLDKEEYRFFAMTALEQNYTQENVFPEIYAKAQSLALIQCFYFNDRFYYSVSDTVRKSYQQLLKLDFPGEKAHADLVNDYAIAATSLYGLLPVEVFIQVFNEQNPRHIDGDEIFALLSKEKQEEFGYSFHNDYLINNDLAENNFASVNFLLEVTKGKPRYLPEKEVLLKYADWNYYEITPEIDELKGYLESIVKDPVKVASILDGIHRFFLSNLPIETCIKHLQKASIQFQDEKKSEAFFLCLSKTNTTTRKWANNGFTDTEIKSIKMAPVRIEKVGRNDACPCNSGKKYKNCCGK